MRLFLRPRDMATFFFVGVALYLFSNCGDTPTAPIGAAVIEGRVLDHDNLRPVQDVLVRSTSFAENTTTDANGFYSLSVDLSDSLTRTITLLFSKAGYDDISVFPVTIKKGTLTNVPDAVIERISDSAETSGGAANIVLVEIESNSISVRGTGGNETSDLVFEVRDSSGVPVDLDHQVTVGFRIAGGPLGGEFLSPDSAQTDINGHVTTTVNSGTKAGAIQIIAEIPGTAIASAPVPIAILGGLPDQAHFTIGAEKLNIAGFRRANIEDIIIAIVGDKYSNPVQTGTAIQFQTTGGIIEGIGLTDTTGRAAVKLITGNPLPQGIPGAAFPFNQPGYALVTAQTVGENQSNVTTSATILFSGSTQITLNSPQPPYSLAANQALEFTFTVNDENGNPLTQGTRISVQTNLGDVSGDINVTLDDYLVRGLGTTAFSFVLTNSTPPQDNAVDATVTISVRSAQNGDLSKTIIVTMQP